MGRNWLIAFAADSLASIGEPPPSTKKALWKDIQAELRVNGADNAWWWQEKANEDKWVEITAMAAEYIDKLFPELSI